MSSEETVRVLVRVRPLLDHEREKSCTDCVQVRDNQIILGGQRAFAFDEVKDKRSTAEDMRLSVSVPMCENTLAGYNTTVMAYGQTGAGKTHTMEAVTQDCVVELFGGLTELQQEQPPGKFTPCVTVALVEVYNDNVYDLLDVGAGKLAIREDVDKGVMVSGVKETDVTSPEEMMELIQKGIDCRRTATTLLNDVSSRSHALMIFNMALPHGKFSKMQLVDLAGSERMKKSHTATTGADRIKECIAINSGLLALGNVITALCDKQSHVPYRSSKLTRLLQDSLGGNSNTVMIACVSCSNAHFDETLNTLKYAYRAKSIVTKAVVNVDANNLEAVVAQLREELDAANAQIRLLRSPASPKEPVAVRGSVRSSTAGGGGSFSGKPRHMDPAGNKENMAGAAAYAAEVAKLEAALNKERGYTRQLESDLFKAEFATMTEKNERLKVQRDLQGVMEVLNERKNSEGGAVPAAPRLQARPRRGDGGEPSPPATPPESPLVDDDAPEERKLLDERSAIVTEQTSIMQERETILRRLQQQSDAPSTDSATEEAEERTEGTEEERYSAAVSAEEDRLMSLSEEIQAKEGIIATLVQQEEQTRNLLLSYSEQLDMVSNEKQDLQQELLRAEQKLEQTEMEKEKRARARLQLKASYEARIKAAEAAELEYHRKKREAEAMIRSQNAEKEKIRRFRSELTTMREQYDLLRQQRKSEALMAGKQRVAHSNEVNALNRRLRELENHNQRLKVALTSKEEEIQRSKAERAKMQPLSRTNTAVKGPTTHTPKGAAVAPLSATQQRMQQERKTVSQVEKDLEECLADKEQLRKHMDQAADNGARLERAKRGWGYRIESLEKQIAAATAPEEKQRLGTELEIAIQRRKDIQESLPQVMSKFKDDIAALEDRIDSLLASKDYHSKAIRQLEHELEVEAVLAGTPRRNSMSRSMPRDATSVSAADRSALDVMETVSAQQQLLEKCHHTISTQEAQIKDLLKRLEGRSPMRSSRSPVNQFPVPVSGGVSIDL